MVQRASGIAIAALGMLLMPQTGRAIDRLILGSKFQVSDPSGSEPKRSVVGVGKEDPTDVPSLSNPTTGGATLTVIANGTNNSSQSFVLDATGWTAVSQGYKYRGPTGTDGDPVKSVVFRRSAAGKLQLKILLKGNVGTDELKVFPPNLGDNGGFILDVVGGDRYCVAFGPGAGGSETRDSVLQWKIVNAVGQPGCPTIPTTTTIANSTTTTSTAPNLGLLCPADPTRTIFAGGPGSQACHQFDGDPVGCNKAFHVGGDGCGASSCYYDFGSCNGCGAQNETRGLCVNTCERGAPSCPGDSSRTIFAGYAQSSACRNLDFSQTLCEKAFHIDRTGQPASCYYDSNQGSCLGCGPTNLQDGACQNTCPVCDGDATRTIFAGSPGSSGCHRFDGNQSSCDAAFVFGDSGAYNSCFYDSGSCSGCGPNNQANQLCINSCPTCDRAPQRQIFVGGPGSSACDIFSNSPVLCEQAFHMSGTCNEIASCFFNYDDSRCEGCGPNNQGAGLCGNVCAAPECGNGIVDQAGEQCDGADAGNCGVDDLCAADCQCRPCTSTVIPAQGGVFVGSTSFGTSGLSSSPSCAFGTDQSPEQVFQWTPSTSGQAVISTCGGTNFDTVVYIRQGSCQGPEIDCRDDYCGVQTTITPFVNAGVTYFIVVDGYGGQSGSFTLAVGIPSSPGAAFLDQ